MRIESMNLPLSETNDAGLGAIKMDRLGNVVIIAGKNGSGKSRFLNSLKNKVDVVSTPSEKILLEQNIKVYEDAIHNAETSVKSLKNSLRGATGEHLQRIERGIIDNEHQLVAHNKRLTGFKLKQLNDTFFKIEPEREGKLIQFVPKDLFLKDSYNVTPTELKNLANNIKIVGTQNTSQSTIAAIDYIIKKAINATSTLALNSGMSEEERNKVNLDYEKLKEYIKVFLNTELQITEEGHGKLFGKRIGEANLSDGQKILLQFCLALYSQGADLDKLIVIMDEPENHLHPAALIEVLDKIIPNLNNGQLWIATHSINVLAHFDPSSIWYMEDGELSYAGNVPQKVLKGLLGNDEEIEKLSHFLSLPAEMASDQFAFESLFYPKVVITKADDPQVAQIHTIIEKMVQEDKKLKVLDFGIGKARLLSTIYENERLKGKDITQWLDFYGYDSYSDHKNICCKVFEDIYGTSDDRYFNERKDILSAHDEKSFDCVVMCNVFHEIDPNEWLDVFTSKLSLFQLLKDDGYLLIIEDQFLAVGEKAHSKGFIVYDTLEFKKLFKIVAGDKYQSTDYRGDGRLKSHHIPKQCIGRIDESSKVDSLEFFQKNASEEIKKIRAKNDASFKNGKLHGFWSQQLANGTLALEEIRK